MTVGFTVSARGDDAEVRVRDHGQPGRLALVKHASAPHARVVLMGRLYYRDDLRARLGRVVRGDQSEPRIEGTGDARLALAIYEREGAAGLERLEGEFALVVLDAAERRLIAMRDPMGGFGLFHRMDGGRFVVSTGTTDLFDRFDGGAVDREYLADYLVAPGYMRQDGPGHRTVYQGLQRVPPASMLIVDLTTGSVRVHRYWDWLQRSADPATEDTAQLAERFRELIRCAVRERLRGTTASHVSGGMDSTAVALVARDCIDGREPLHTLSLVYHRFPRLARERVYVESALDAPGLAPIRINGDDVLDFDSLGSAPAHDEPNSSLVRLCASDQALCDAAGREGVSTILTGFGADDLFSVQPFHLADLLRGGHFIKAWRDASTWGLARNCSAWELLRTFGFSSALPAWSRMGARNWLRGGYAPWPDNTEWTIPPWVRRDFARRYDLRGRMLENTRRNRTSGQRAGMSILLSSIEVYQDGFSRCHVAAPRGILLAHPFLDPRVFTLGLGVRLRVHPEPGGQKPILAAAMRGIVPDCILDRPSKGSFNEAYYAGLSRNLGRLQAMVERAPTEELEFLDKPVLLDCLQRAALGNAGDAGVLMQLNGTLSLCVWLLQQRRIVAGAQRT